MQFDHHGNAVYDCDNGLRCAAYYAHTVLQHAATMTIEYGEDIRMVSVQNGRVRLALPNPIDFRDLSPLEVSNGIFYFYHLRIGMPHVVIFEDSLREVDIELFGRQISRHEHFLEDGVCVNFAHIDNASTVSILTYDGRNQTENVSSEAGAAAAAILSALINKCSSPVAVRTRAGETIHVSFTKDVYDVKDVYVEAAVSHSFEGLTRIEV